MTNALLRLIADRTTEIPPTLYEIADDEFHAIRRWIYDTAGISLGPAKRALVCSRLARRLRALNLTSYGQYLDYVTARDYDGRERQEMVNCLTTNKTDFYREAHHFDYLANTIVPSIARATPAGARRTLRIWSAGCSMGDEPYTIAVTLLEALGKLDGWDIEILATDINTAVLATARHGIYPIERIAPVPPHIRQKYFLRGHGENDGSCKVRPEVQRLITFRQLNFMDSRWPVSGKFDVIFCRNVIIYFDADTQRKLLLRFADYLTDDGHLILGHSENLHWLVEHFTLRGNTIYQMQRRASGASRSLDAETPATPPAARVRRPRDVAARRPAPASAPASAPAAAPGESSPRRAIVAGEYFASPKPMILSTVLGSCVAPCLFDPQSGIGGITHFMLPYDINDDQASARYGINALELLINAIMKLGGDRRRLQAKAFGGASLFPVSRPKWNVGQRNIDFIHHFLEVEKIPLLSEKLGGNRPMQVYFHTQTGRAWVKTIASLSQVMRTEQQYNQHAAETIRHPAPDNVTLF